MVERFPYFGLNEVLLEGIEEDRREMRVFESLFVCLFPFVEPKQVDEDSKWSIVGIDVIDSFKINDAELLADGPEDILGRQPPVPIVAEDNFGAVELEQDETLIPETLIQTIVVLLIYFEDRLMEVAGDDGLARYLNEHLLEY